jgi:hypothetical protein
MHTILLLAAEKPPNSLPINPERQATGNNRDTAESHG